jgi:hypothetical protein
MRTASAALPILLLVTGLAGSSAQATEMRALHRYAFWRVWAQDCYLMPDVVVAVNALGPYCSSPRGRYYRTIRR